MKPWILLAAVALLALLLAALIFHAPTCAKDAGPTLGHVIKLFGC